MHALVGFCDGSLTGVPRRMKTIGQKTTKTDGGAISKASAAAGLEMRVSFARSEARGPDEDLNKVALKDVKEIPKYDSPPFCATVCALV